MTDLLLHGTPDNMRLPGRLKGARMMTSDVFNVCEQIKQLDPNLYVVLHEGHEKPFVVMEHCIDGQERMVKRYAELDSRILADLRKMITVPWSERYKQLAREIDAHNRKQEAAWEESEAHERFTFELGKALRESGIATGRTPAVHMYRGS